MDIHMPHIMTHTVAPGEWQLNMNRKEIASVVFYNVLSDHIGDQKCF